MELTIGENKINVPEGLSPEQMDEVVDDYANNFGNSIGKDAQQSPWDEASPKAAAKWKERKPFLDRLGESFVERELNMERADKAIAKAQEKGDLTPIAADTIRVTSKFGQGVAMVVDDVILGLLEEAGTAAFQAIPDYYENILRGTPRETISAVLNTEVGKAGIMAARMGFDTYQEWKEDHPIAAINLETGFNVSKLYPLSKTTSAASKGSRTIGSGLKQSGEASEKKIRKKYIDKIIEPIDTKKTRLESVGRSEVERSLGGVGPKRVVTRQSHKMSDVANSVETVEGINPKNLMQENYNLLDNSLIKSDKALKKSLADKGFTFPKTELQTRINRNLEKAAKDGVILGGDGKLSAQTKAVIEKAKKLIDEKKASGDSLLEIRQELDDFVRDKTRRISGKTVFDDVKTTDYNTVLKEIRDTMNDFLDEKAELAGLDKRVRDELKRSHHIYIARDNIKEKAEREAATWLGRTAKSVANAIPVSGSSAKTLAFLGAGATGTAVYTFIPGAVAVGAGVGGTALIGSMLVRGAVSPAARKMLGNLLTVTDKAIKASDKIAAKELKKNKAVLIRLLKASPKGKQE